ncbi:curli production assembly/transport component CsgG [Candidatus Scalindua japonica]|uniref:Curli production assembly/transport component CsgG n=1 Tax=Candidatus Scalindua japonica TaxID=1284222 RepID=A0A286U0N1_9BACT|nr:CsgG/HfaB family protein [Candidatus Scalindua japonica]GAX61697.1 curli production assembly/transport component CsgG [Candidatus Scalindua japonica]
MEKLSNLQIIMKQYAVVVFFLVSSCAAIEKVSEVDINENFPHDEIQKIAVIMFQTNVDHEEKSLFFSNTSISPNAGTVLASMIARELVKLDRYVVVNRKAVEEDLESKNLKIEDFLLTQSYLDLGKQLGVDAIVIGRVEGFGVSYKTKTSGIFLSPLVTKVSFTVKCVDVTTNETIWAVKIKGSSIDDNERVLSSRLISETFETLKIKLN